MDGGFVGEIVNLVAAGSAGGDDNGGCAFGANLREEAAFANLARDIEVVFRVAEGARHTAAAGIEINDGGAGDLREKSFRGRQEAHRFLVAVAVKQDFGGALFEPKRHCGGVFLEKHAGFGDDLRAALLFAAKE